MFSDSRLQQEFEKVAKKRSFPAGTELIRPGDPIDQIPIVAKGSLRIVLQDAKGHERFLYHIMPGESCALSLMCCTTRRTSSILAVVEEDAELVFVPAQYTDAWMEFAEWRKYVSDTQAQRFGELLETLEVVAFRKMDDQLLDLLMKRVQATGNMTLKITHQEIATELNSPREVITRLLHQLQNRGAVTIGRGSVEVHVPAIMRNEATAARTTAPH
jgi:CRP/FNR family transcriptional regulator, anaerobic regulatory protein